MEVRELRTQRGQKRAAGVGRRASGNGALPGRALVREGETVKYHLRHLDGAHLKRIRILAVEWSHHLRRHVTQEEMFNLVLGAGLPVCESELAQAVQGAAGARDE